MIAAFDYPELVSKYRVTGVPKIIVSDDLEILGVVTEEEFVQRLVQAAA